MTDLIRVFTNYTTAVNEAFMDNANKLYNAGMTFATEVSKINPFTAINNSTNKK
jgi:hypothetical protein